MDQLLRVFRRYLNKEASHEEQRLVDTWYDSYEDDTATPWSTPEQEEHARRESLGVITRRLGLRVPAQITLHRKARLLRMGRNAAVAAALLTGIIITLLHLRKDHTSQPLTAGKSLLPDRHFATGIGERKKLTLPDGSTIWLNSGSRLRVHHAWVDSLREVWLEDGEAFFTIAPDAKRPFIVHTVEMTTRVLGTSFNINAYKDLPQAVITVSSGKVGVGKGRQQYGILAAGQQLAKEQNDIHIRTVKPGDITAWLDGRFVLQQASFAELSHKAFLAWGKKLVTTRKTLQQAKYSLDLPPGTGWQQGVTVISAIHYSQYRVKGDTVVLY